MKRRNEPRLDKRRVEQFGGEAHVHEIRRMPCICGGKHPACTGGWSDPSHAISRAAGGKLEHIVPMSAGCHGAWHQHGRLTYLQRIGWTWEQLLERARELAIEADRRADELPI